MRTRPDAMQRGWVRRLGWLALFWICGVAAMGALSVMLRLLMRLAGMAS